MTGVIGRCVVRFVGVVAMAVALVLVWVVLRAV
jgi:hypothetical protein